MGYKISFIVIPSDKNKKKITCISFPPYFVSKKERKNPKTTIFRIQHKGNFIPLQI